MTSGGTTDAAAKSPASELVEDGRAKVNLTLRVVGRRVDGYHDLESVVAFADCADRLSLNPGTELQLVTAGPLAEACGEVADNLVLGAYARRRGGTGVQQRLQDVYERFPRLAERRRQKAHTLSGGERQMLALGRALMAQPVLLMLDEPSLGLAPLIVREIFRIVASLRDAGVSILLVEQNARAALETADYGYVLETGEITYQGPAADLVRDPRVNATYLGGSV